MITVILGYPYSGKSTFIAENPDGILGEIDRNKVEFLAPFIKNEKEPYDGMILHLSKGGKSKTESPKPILEKLISKVGRKNIRIFMLIVPATELIERAIFDQGKSGRANNAIYIRDGKRLSADDIIQHHINWMKIVKSLKVKVNYVKSSLGETRLVSQRVARKTLAETATATRTKMSYNEVMEFVEKGDYPKYHSVDLPYGLASKGQNIADRFPTIFPNKMKGWSALDIGCALGGFSYEAERRGAKVLASDIRKVRLNAAKKFADILCSDVEFTDKNWLLPDPANKEKFDLVLILNVLHHVPDPEEAIEVAASLSKGVVVMEFPNSHDPLYKAEGMVMKNLVGPILMERVDLFEEIRLHPSAKDGRIIAVCFMNNAKKYRAAYAYRPFDVGPKGAGMPRHEREILFRSGKN